MKAHAWQSASLVHVSGENSSGGLNEQPSTYQLDRNDFTLEELTVDQYLRKDSDKGKTTRGDAYMIISEGSNYFRNCGYQF